MTRRIHYCYLLTRALPEGGCMYYVGIRTAPTNKTPETDTSYMGSGNRIRRAVKAHGRAAFSKTVVDVFETRDEAKAMERALVGLATANSKWSYNLREGGQDGGLMSDESRAATSAATQRVWDLRTRQQRDAHAEAVSAAMVLSPEQCAARAEYMRARHADPEKKARHYSPSARAKCSAAASASSAAFWASMTPDERSAEMKRRAAVARENQRIKREVQMILAALIVNKYGGAEAA